MKTVKQLIFGITAIALLVGVAFFRQVGAQTRFLSGAAAISGLRAAGGNDSLREAFRAAAMPQSEATQVRLTAPDGETGDDFGQSVAISGNTAFIGSSDDDIGAHLEQGSVYIFVKSGATWSLQQKLTADDAVFFGTSVAVSGNTLIVGAPWSKIGATERQGAAYIFTSNGTTWTLQQKLTAADGATNDNFGRSVAISGTNAIIGANQDSIGANSEQGSAYMFYKSGANWLLQNKITAPDGAPNDFFGYSVAISGNTAVIGAAYHTVGSNKYQGSAYVFIRGFSWLFQAQLNSPDGKANDEFGVSVAIEGNTAIIGAYHADYRTIFAQGAAYVFVRSGTAWSQQARLNPQDRGTKGFGNSVGIYGEKVIVGAFGDDIGANYNQGSAYIFTRSGAVWTQQDKLIAADGAADDAFGVTVGISGDTTIVGTDKTINGNIRQGAVYIFN